MNFALSEQQEMLRKSARDFLAEKCPKAYVKQMESDEKGYSAALWQEMAKLGWLGLPRLKRSVLWITQRRSSMPISLAGK